MSEPKAQSKGRPRHTLAELLAQCDYSQPLTEEERAWFDLVPVGREIGSGEFDDDEPPQDRDWLLADRDRSLPQERESLLNPADYDDPRNFGLDPQQQEAAAAAKQRKKEVREAAEDVMEQYRNTLKKLAE